jgi:predicted CXXCH cytochrome family protein
VNRFAFPSGGLDNGRPRSSAVDLLLTILFPVCLFAFATFAPLPARAQVKNSCIECHAKLPDSLSVNAEEFSASIHAQKGVSCTGCHGGDASTDDLERSMSPQAGFKRNIGRAQIPALCAKCHSDATYMRSFNPSLRTDQFSQYQTSVHGKQLAKGDTQVAVCTDCHTTHNVRAPNDPQSSVYVLNVAQTCANCHAKPEYMKAYKIPTGQFSLYSSSVHHEALVVRGDTSAPTCSTCHGSHGAAPPGVASVERVCSTCHVFQQQLFDSGPHKEVFQAINLSGCITCHSNHGIQRPTDAMIGAGKDSVCVKCHLQGESAFEAAEKMHNGLAQLEQEITRSEDLLSRAANAGVEVGETGLAITEARDDLTKARVAIHSVRVEAVDQELGAGMKVAQSTYQAGLAAITESRNRRRGLLVSLSAILLVLISVALMIRRLESRNSKADGQAGPQDRK